MAEDPPILPAHIEATVQAIARLHADHRRGGTPLQRAVDRITAFVGSTRFAGIIAIFVFAWIAANLTLHAFGRPPLDSPPFPYLQDLASVLAFCMTILIFTTQRHEDQLSELREQLTLELAIQSDQKVAKLIQLIEELRRDTPSVPNRRDAEAEVLGLASDPEAVLSALRENQRGDEPPAANQAAAQALVKS